MSLKKTVKKVIKKVARKSGAVNSLYNNAIAKKRQRMYERYSEMPVDGNLVVFESFMGRKYADSPRAIYEKLKEYDEYEELRFIWCFRDSVRESFSYLADEPRTSIVRWGSEEYYKTYAHAGFWITNTRVPAAIKRRAGQEYVQCWHGTPLKRLGCDIETEATEPKEVTYKVFHDDASRYTYFISPSPFYTAVMSSAFDLKALGKEDIILETGYPRNDFIVNHTEEDCTSIRKRLGIPENKKVILYAPTYRENQKNRGVGYRYSEPLDFQHLKEKISDEYVMLFRAHYYIAQQFDFEEYSDFIIDASDYPEINDLYIISDLLITDYSSVFFDYGILRRPVIFYMYDLEFYRDELRGFYLDLSELPGPITQNQEELEKLILDNNCWSNSEEYAKIYDAFTKRFAPYEDGHATDRVIEIVFGKK